MKLHVLSDLHIDFCPFVFSETDADVIVLAGDAGEHKKKYLALNWLIAQDLGKPVIYVQGNHEYYRGSIPHVTEGLRKRAEGTQILILENDKVTINGVTFLGCTLWSDFEIFGMEEKDYAMMRAWESMNDYKLIRCSAANYSRLHPRDTAGFNRASRRWLSDEMKRRDHSSPIVVITHHAPSILSMPAKHRSEALGAAYACNMEELIRNYRPDLWIHGHIHTSCDYMVGDTRVVCNPRGYAHEEKYANAGFDPRLVIEL